MHGSIAGLRPELAGWARDQQKLGVSTIESTRGFARELAFTHDVTKARQAYTAALEISRVTGRNLNQVEIATAFATGQTTALARYIGTIKAGRHGRRSTTVYWPGSAGRPLRIRQRASGSGRS